jgi:hypothetical protein
MPSGNLPQIPQERADSTDFCIRPENVPIWEFLKIFLKNPVTLFGRLAFIL